jgi:hypothetical protein
MAALTSQYKMVVIAHKDVGTEFNWVLALSAGKDAKQ